MATLGAEESIVVVSGLPRSGTSLMMSVLEAAGLPLLCDGKRPPDASNPRGYYELEAVKRTRADAGWIDDAPGKAVKVIHHLLTDLPNHRSYRVVLMARPVEAVVASQNRMLEALAEAPPPLADDRLGEILRTQLEKTRTLLDNEPHFEWIEIDYPSLVCSPLPGLRRVIRFLALPCKASKLAGVVEPDLQHEGGLHELDQKAPRQQP